MQKDADAFRTISEVAADLALPQHVLRFWETRFPQVRPLKRAGGRRYYRPADIALLRTIRHLLYEDGYTIKGVQRLLKEQGPKGLAAAVGAPPPLDTGSAEVAAAPPPNAAEAPFAPRTIVEPLLPNAVPTVPDAGLADGQRRAIEDALATIEDCKRVLDALNRPPTIY